MSQKGGQGQAFTSPRFTGPQESTGFWRAAVGTLGAPEMQSRGDAGKELCGLRFARSEPVGSAECAACPFNCRAVWSVDGGGGETPAETRRLDLCKRPKLVMTGLEPLPSATLGPACCPSGFVSSLCLPVLCWHLTGCSPCPCGLGWQGEAGGGAQRGLQCREERGLSSRVWAFGGGCQISPGAEHCSS